MNNRDGFIFQPCDIQHDCERWLRKGVRGDPAIQQTFDLGVGRALLDYPKGGIKMQMKKKHIAALIAFVMLAVGIVAVPGVDDADASTTLSNNVDVYVVDGTTTTSKSVYAYDLYQALTTAINDSEFSLNAVTTTTTTVVVDSTTSVTTNNSSWNKDVFSYYDANNEAQYYKNPNENYGTLSTVTIGETTYPSGSFSVYVYQKPTNGTAYSWTPALPAIGWYHPFADYSAYYTSNNTDYSLAAAAIAIVVNNGSTPTEGRTPMTVTSNTNRCLYTFVLKGPNATGAIGKEVLIFDPRTGTYQTKVLEQSDLTGNGITITGWGSNAHEALKVAVCNNMEVTSLYHQVITSPSGNYDQYYGWYNTILGVGTVTIDLGNGNYEYHWWQTSANTGSGLVSTGYSFAYYSLLSGAQNVLTSSSCGIEYI